MLKVEAAVRWRSSCRLSLQTSLFSADRAAGAHLCFTPHIWNFQWMCPFFIHHTGNVRMSFNQCAQNKCKTLQQRMFFLRKLNDFRLDCSILQLFYQSLLQSISSCGLVCVYGSMHAKDHKPLQCIKTASRVIGVDQTSAVELLYIMSLF